MSFYRLTPDFWVAPPLDEADIAVAAEQGVATILSNRPDREADGRPTAAMIGAFAARNGIAFAHVPVEPGKITDADVTRTAELVADGKGPVLAYCRNGARSASLWALTRSGRDDPDAILRTASPAGLDLEPLRSRLTGIPTAGPR